MGKGGARLYIISPDGGAQTQFEAGVLAAGGWRPAALMASLALPTLAALAPDDFPVEVCDERVSPPDFDHPAEHVWITCNSRQFERMRALAGEFRRRGRTVTVGGPFATLSPEAVRPFCDILFRGELETAAEGLFADLRAGRWKDEYVGPRADLARSPVPRWDLYPNGRVLTAAVQASRGCPNDCGFCEVIRYYGRAPRRKGASQVLAELDEVYRLGYRRVFLTDDNLAAQAGEAKELLEAVARWNGRRRLGRVEFYAQMTPADGRDPELLSLAARAGVRHAYVGVETSDRAGLVEAGKRRNLGFELDGALRAFFAHGIAVIASLIAGFDADGPDVFRRHEEFIRRVPLPLAQVGPLVLTSGTPLHERFRAEGRLRWGGLVSGLPWITNVLPKSMTQEELMAGLAGLSRRLYEPAAFTERFRGFLGRARWEGPGAEGGMSRRVDEDARALVRRRLAGDPALAPLAALVRKAGRRMPGSAAWLRAQVFLYLQARFLFPGPG